MRDPAQAIDSLDLESMLGGPLDVRPHRAQHPNQVVGLRLAGGILDHGGALRENRGEKGVFGAHHRDVRELDDGTAKVPLRSVREVVAVLVLDLGAHGGHRLDVQVHGPPSYPVTTGIADDHAPESAQQRPEQDEGGAHLHGRLQRHEEPLGGRGPDLEGVVIGPLHLEADVAHRLAQDGDVTDTGHVVEDAWVVGERRRSHELQHRILRPGDLHVAVQRLAAGDDELLHGPQSTRGGRASGRPGFLPLVRAGVVSIAQAQATAQVAAMETRDIAVLTTAGVAAMTSN